MRYDGPRAVVARWFLYSKDTTEFSEVFLTQHDPSH